MHWDDVAIERMNKDHTSNKCIKKVNGQKKRKSEKVLVGCSSWVSQETEEFKEQMQYMNLCTGNFLLMIIMEFAH